MKTQLILGDCLDKLKDLEDNSVDSIVTDPPYGLSFMGKDWDKVKATKETKSQIVKGLGAGMKMTSHADNVEFGKWVAEWSAECLRVLKPGGYMLAFGGSRMYHRLACGVEDAGFEIRDQIMWVYGSGFPKSHNISKQLDKRGGNNHLVSEVSQKLKEARESRGISKTEADKLFCDSTTNYMWFEGRKDGVRLPDDVSFEKICNEWSELKPYQDKIKSANREVVGNYDGDMGGLGGERLGNGGGDITISATDVAKEWEGWGTALKPAHEPIVMARKPLIGTVADNVLEYGVGGINIDATRIGFVSDEDKQESIGKNQHADYDTKMGTNNVYGDYSMLEPKNYNPEGRWPANVILDEEAGMILDKQSGITAGGHWPHTKTTGFGEFGGGNNEYFGVGPKDKEKGGASRFFYCPKSSKKDRNEGMPEEVGVFIQRPRREDGSVIYKETHPEEWTEVMSKKPRKEKTSLGAAEEILQEKKIKGRDEGQDNTNVPHKARPVGRANIHPTVKPTELMKYLIRLVTPKGGIVLDPFMGSGSTGKAAVLEGMEFIGIEREKEYYEIAEQRIGWVNKPAKHTEFFE